MPVSQDDEFYVGYAPPMPSRLSRFVRRAVMVIGGGVLIWGGLAGAGHVSLDGGTFEFGRPKDFSGVVFAQPYPGVQLDRSEGTDTPTALLVAPGKHGADELAGGFEGRRVAFRGTRIRRGAHLMIELDPATLATDKSRARVSDSSDKPLDDPAGTAVNVTGEVVDTKCFLGVMVPGAGKTHKDCASLCLRGGIPPALNVQDRAGRSSLLLLTGPAGEQITSTVVETAGESVSIAGDLRRQRGWLVLRSDPGSWRAAVP